MEGELRKLRHELAQLQADFDITLGRANGLHMAAAVFARGWGKPASALIAHLEQAIERTEATALPTPLPDATIRETRRVAETVLAALRHAQQEGG